MRTTSKKKTTSKPKQPQNDDDLKKEDNLILKTVPGPSLHNISCPCFLLKAVGGSDPKLKIPLFNFSFLKPYLSLLVNMYSGSSVPVG